MRNIRKRERRTIKINIMKKVCDNIKLFLLHSVDKYTDIWYNICILNERWRQADVII